MRVMAMVIGVVCAGAADLPAHEPDAAAEAGVALVFGENRVRVEIGGALLTEFVFGPGKTGGMERPYLYPVIGPGGVEMTRGWPIAEVERAEAHDHPHHTSMWFAHGAVNGEDFWQGKGRFALEGAVQPTEGGLTARYRMLGGDGEQVGWYTLGLAFGGDEKVRWIEETSIFKPIEGGRLEFGDTKEGTFAIRTHPALRLEAGSGVEQVTGRAINSAGVEGKAVWGKRAAWVDYWGEIDGRRVGVAIFDHPTNPRHPTWWQAREYGLIAANPFGITAFEGGEADRGDLVVEAGGSLRFVHRFVLHAGSTDEAGVTILYDAWVRDSRPADEAPKEDQP